jgi:hypothetical protein
MTIQPKACNAWAVKATGCPDFDTGDAALSALAIISTFLSVQNAIILYLGVALIGMMFAMLIASVDMKEYHNRIHHK